MAQNFDVQNVAKCPKNKKATSRICEFLLFLDLFYKVLRFLTTITPQNTIVRIHISFLYFIYR